MVMLVHTFHSSQPEPHRNLIEMVKGKLASEREWVVMQLCSCFDDLTQLFSVAVLVMVCHRFSIHRLQSF